MANIWITYSWKDNENKDIDYIAQELINAGLVVKLDRWNIGAGKRLWDQIENFIINPAESDAWLLIATQNSLQSEPCKEEYMYALQRALENRGTKYPVIALFIGPVDESLVPSGIKTRLFVSITDPDWKERIVSAAKGITPKIDPTKVMPYMLKVHENLIPRKYAIEVRPRAGVWDPFFAAIPLNEKESVNLHIMIGPIDRPTAGGMLTNSGEGESPDGLWWIKAAGNQANPTRSYYIWCNELPSELIFGVNGGKPKYLVKMRGK